MLDKFNQKVEKGRATVYLYGQILKVQIYEVQDEDVYFKTINPQVGEFGKGHFNRIEASRYLWMD